jgi:prepilin-type N-terminal cleavage/methylation domain-containing protein
MRPSTQSGMTLIEVIVAIVIITAGAGTILGLMSSISLRSSQAMTATQRANIAKAYLDEVLSSQVCNDAAGSREDHSCVAHYNGINEPVTDRYGASVNDLSGYTVRIDVLPAAIGGSGAANLPAISGPNRQLVVVRVTDANDPQEFSVLSGIKTNHP